MTSAPDDPNIPARLSKSKRRPGELYRIVVHPDEVYQRGARAWLNTSLLEVVGRFLLISTVLVALGVGAFAAAIGLLR